MFRLNSRFRKPFLSSSIGLRVVTELVATVCLFWLCIYSLSCNSLIAKDPFPCLDLFLRARVVLDLP